MIHYITNQILRPRDRVIANQILRPRDRWEKEKSLQQNFFFVTKQQFLKRFAYFCPILS